MKITPATAAAIIATPPTAPPTIAPIGVGFEVGDAVEDLDGGGFVVVAGDGLLGVEKGTAPLPLAPLPVGV